MMMMVMAGVKTVKLLLMLVRIKTLAMTTEARDHDHDGDTSHTSQLVLASFLLQASTRIASVSYFHLPSATTMLLQIPPLLPA